MNKSGRYGSRGDPGKVLDQVGLSSRRTSQEPKEEVLSVFDQTLSRLFELYQRESLQYRQSLVGMQNEFIHANKRAVETSLLLQERMINNLPYYPKAELTTPINVGNFMETCLKINEMQNQIILAVIEAAEQNVRFMSEGTKHFQNMTQSMIATWQFWKVR